MDLNSLGPLQSTWLFISSSCLFFFKSNFRQDGMTEFRKRFPGKCTNHRARANKVPTVTRARLRNPSSSSPSRSRSSASHRARTKTVSSPGPGSNPGTSRTSYGGTSSTLRKQKFATRSRCDKNSFNNLFFKNISKRLKICNDSYHKIKMLRVLLLRVDHPVVPFLLR